MVRRYCCVPGCKSGYRSQRKVERAEGKPGPSMFIPPRDAQLFEEWKRVMRKAGKELTRVDSVCELHFVKEDVEKYYVINLSNGRTNMLKRGRPTLRAGAVPFINSSQTKNIRNKGLTTKAKPENEAYKDDYETNEEENIQEDGTEESATNIMDNILNGVTHTSADDADKYVQEDETNNSTKEPKVGQSKTSNPIIITDVRSVDNACGLGEKSKGPNSSGLKIKESILKEAKVYGKGQGINIKRVEIKKPISMVKIRPNVVKKIQKERNILEKEASPSYSQKKTLMEKIEAASESCLEERSKKETTTSGGRVSKRNHPDENEDIEISNEDTDSSKTKRQRQDTGSILEGFPPISQSSILERLDAMNSNIETNTCALRTLSKTISDSSKENVRALNSLTEAITKVGSIIFASMHQTGINET